MSVLERGGNAADAAVAAGFVLQVVEPHLNGPGGEVPILLWDPAAEQVEVVAGQGVTPAAATPEHFTDLGLDLVPGTGLLAATVPAAMGAWLTLLHRWGTWSLRAVLEPAISYAEQGWPLLPAIARTIGSVANTFTADWSHSADTWLEAGRVPTAGTRKRNPELAATWARLLSEAEAAGADREVQIEAARAVFYKGFVAEAIDAHGRRAFRDSSGELHTGLLTGADLASWRCPVERPVSYDYGEYTVCKTASWGQGPVFLQQLALLKGFDLPAMEPADFLHTVVEAGKLAFADREAWYGDPVVVDVPLAELLSDAYNDSRRTLISRTASAELRPGSPGGRAPVFRPVHTEHGVTSAGAGEPTVAPDGSTRGDTCHLDVVDRHGMMISATPSGGWLQSSPTIEGLGFCLGSRAQMTWLEPGLASSLRPGVRPRSTLSPSLALVEGRPYLAFGTPGGDQQDQWSLLFFLLHVHFGLDLQAAIDAPSLHSLHAPGSFWPRTANPVGLVLEDRFPEDVVAELRRRGHDVSLAGGWTLGRLSAVGYEPGTGFLRAAANPRGSQGYAVGR